MKDERLLAKFKNKDIKDGIIHNGRYDKNPTAQNINDMINGNYIGDKRTNIAMPYTIEGEYSEKNNLVTFLSAMQRSKACIIGYIMSVEFNHFHLDYIA